MTTEFKCFVWTLWFGFYRFNDCILSECVYAWTVLMWLPLFLIFCLLLLLLLLPPCSLLLFMSWVQGSSSFPESHRSKRSYIPVWHTQTHTYNHTHSVSLPSVSWRTLPKYFFFVVLRKPPGCNLTAAASHRGGFRFLLLSLDVRVMYLKSPDRLRTRAEVNQGRNKSPSAAHRVQTHCILVL